MKRLRGLYVIVDPAACRSHGPVEVTRLALDGGAAAIQWRDKLRDKGLQLEDARAIHLLCGFRNALFIANDHADLAMAVGADGVHLGQGDLPVATVRSIVGDRMILGVSTNTVDEARSAEEDGADYVAVGAVFATQSKEATRPASLDRLREVKMAVRVPVVAIGGITPANVHSIVEAGADAAAVIGAVCGADDPRTIAAALAAAFA